MNNHIKPKNKRYLKVRYESFAMELGRFTKTSGWHYYIDLREPVIVHHQNKWSVVPYKGGFRIGDIIVREDYIESKNQHFGGLDIPYYGFMSSRKLYNEILKAIVKYALGVFLQKEYADGSFISVDLSYKLVPRRKQGEKLKLITDDELFLNLIDDISNGNIFIKLDPQHTPLVKNGEFIEKWKIEPYDAVRGYFLINNRYILAYDLIFENDFLYEHERHGVALCDAYYFSAKDIREALLSTIAKYVLARFGVDTTKISKLSISFESTH
jgi:hypothetical protein